MELDGFDPQTGIVLIGATNRPGVLDPALLRASRRELKNKMAVLLGGRAAEALTFDDISTGAVDDIDRATEIARNMVTRFGMSEALGQIAYESLRPSFLGGIPMGEAARHDYSEETSREIDCAVRALIKEAFDAAVAILTLHRAALEEGSELLLQKETLRRDELPALTGEAEATKAAINPPAPVVPSGATSARGGEEDADETARLPAGGRAAVAGPALLAAAGSHAA